ncbi:MAG: universal stress protein [Anaerolineae bacterium]|nr:universal stress protein [Anaerolineae bacterium]MCO5189051.1 universal stress protein [Anaerolineae bacterium]MCO5193586.1 universal stress protein [Anaerolineae bacterium]MCO5197494.1 universal stress protein [Anaerolineae bacterium]MCO5205715.1 universal stress protein [Anaerolineae bacterium]
MHEERQVIVCATRGGEGSRALQQEAVARSRHGTSLLIFVYVVNHRELGNLEEGEIPYVEEELSWLGETLLLLAQNRAKEAGVSAETVIRTGSPLAEIAQVARNYKANRIMLGAPRGTTANVFGDDEIERAATLLSDETGISVEIVRPEPLQQHA